MIFNKNTIQIRLNYEIILNLEKSDKTLKLREIPLRGGVAGVSLTGWFFIF